MKRSVSVVVCTYNRCERLGQTLQALRQQRLPEGMGYEVIVVDNNSTDRTKALVEACASDARCEIRYVFEPTQGLSHARNHGIREARGTLIVFTDDDVIPAEDWLHAVHRAFIEHEADCVGGKILPLWEQTPPSWAVSDRLRKGLSGMFGWLDHGPEPVAPSLSDGRLLFGANMAFQKSVFDELGPFRTDLGLVGGMRLKGEDTEMVIRVMTAGKRAWYTPEAVIYHQVQVWQMRLAYARRWKFDAGLTAVRMSGRTFRSVPGWLIRECAHRGLSAVAAYARGHWEDGIEHELVAWHQAGEIVGGLTGLGRRPIARPGSLAATLPQDP